MTELVLKYINNIKTANVGNMFYTTEQYATTQSYIDTKNKVCILFTPRAGCSVVIQMYLDLVGLLADGLEFDPFIHLYRFNLLQPNIPTLQLDYLIHNKYQFIKFILSPYIRAVSVFRMMSETLNIDLSFRQWLNKLICNEISFTTNSIRLHIEPQYRKGEEEFITKYICINKNEKYSLTLHNGDSYELDVHKYTSPHHGKRKDINVFCGDMPRSYINNHLPNNYKYFYDDDIKRLVEVYYKDDIEKYGFTFDL